MTNRTCLWLHERVSSLLLGTHTLKELLWNSWKKTFRNRWKDLKISCQWAKSQPQNGEDRLFTLQP